MNNYLIRTRIVAALALPILGLLWLSGMVLTSKYEILIVTERLAGLTKFATTISAAVHELQKERGLSAGFLASKGASYREQLASQRASVDQARQLLTDAMALESQHPGSATLSQATELLGTLASTRNRIDSLSIPGPDSFAFYTNLIGALLGGVSDLTLGSTDIRVANLATAYLHLVQGKERAGQERAVGNGVVSSGSITPEDFRRLTELAAFQEADFGNFDRFSAPELVTALKAASTGGGEVNAMRKAMASELHNRKITAFTAPEWFQARTNRINRLKGVEDRAAQALASQAGAVRDEALRALLVTASVVAMLMVITIVLATAIVRGVSGPLT